MEELRRLEWLNLAATDITDDSFVWLSDTNLKHLGVAETAVSDAGMPTIADFPELHSVDLTATSVSNRGLGFVRDAVNLDTLFLEGSQIDADGVPALESLPKLKALSLTPRIHSRGLETLRELPELKHLAVFDGTDLTGTLQHLSQLKSLLLREPGDIAEDLATMQDLRWLIVMTKTPDPQQLRTFREAAPRCNVRSYTSVTEARKAFRTLAKNY